MTKKRITYTYVVLYKKDYPSDTIKKDSMAKVDQLQTISRKNLGRKLRELNEKDKAKLDISLIASLGLQERVEKLIQGAHHPNDRKRRNRGSIPGFFVCA